MNGALATSALATRPCNPGSGLSPGWQVALGTETRLPGANTSTGAASDDEDGGAEVPQAVSRAIVSAALARFFMPPSYAAATHCSVSAQRRCASPMSWAGFEVSVTFSST